MAKEIQLYELDKIKKVKIDEVRPNSWNPKEKNHKKVEDIKKSIEMHGFKQPVQVRSNDGYEIIDGEQRWTAMKELGATEIYIYDNGVISDEDAKNETLWWQVQVPFETVELAHLVTELSAMEFELPYTPKEIAEFKEMSEFDFDKYGKDRPEDADPEEPKSFAVKLNPEQYRIVMEAIENIKEQNECGDARALELLAADYLAGV